MGKHVSLDSIERSWRKDVRRESRRIAAGGARESACNSDSLGRDPPWWKLSAVAALATPFLIAVGIFVPFFGQALVLLVVALSVLLLLAKRSWTLAISLIGGSAIGGVLLATFASVIQREGVAFYYLLLAFAVFISGSCCVALGGQIWRHYERGRQALRQEVLQHRAPQ